MLNEQVTKFALSLQSLCIFIITTRFYSLQYFQISKLMKPLPHILAFQ